MIYELNSDNNYCVYCHINKINNKFYIGITGQKAEQRWGSNGCNYGRQSYFGSAIQKYGWDNFEHVVLIDQLTKEEACKIEVLLIALLDTQNPNHGYNMTSGGDIGTFGLKMSDEIKNKISESLKGRKAWNKGIKMPPRKPTSTNGRKNIKKRRTRAKKVVQYDFYGNFIKIWDSITEASNFFNVNHTCIIDCCKGKQKTSCGFIWKYFTEEDTNYDQNISV